MGAHSAPTARGDKNGRHRARHLQRGMRKDQGRHAGALEFITSKETEVRGRGAKAAVRGWQR